jgi:hypothetical protein
MPKAKQGRIRVTKKQIGEQRIKSKKDTGPDWTNSETWTTDHFYKMFHEHMTYYRTEFKASDLKPAVLSWMAKNDYSKSEVERFKKSRDWRCNLTMGSVASNLLRGMPEVRADFNDGKNTAEWLRTEVNKILEACSADIEPEEAEDKKASGPQLTIQDRVRESTYPMTEEIEEAYLKWQTDTDNFNPKEFKLLNLLKGKQAKAAHARIIRDFYAKDLAELAELASGDADEQLKEGYRHRSKRQIRALMEFLGEIVSACDMLMQEAKTNRKPRAKKPTDKTKLVSRLKYKKTDDALKLVSVNPLDIVGAKELWVYNSKYRKLGRYIAAEFQELTVKGTSIAGYDENASIQKTLRKPEEKLKEFKTMSKVQLRKFLDTVNSVDTKLNGRINEEIVLLKTL